VVAELKNEFGADAKVDHEKNGTWMLERPGCGHAFLSFMPAKIPYEEAERNTDGNLFWPNAREELKPYATHVIAGVLQGPDDAVEGSLLVSRLARSAVKAFDGIGVYWGNGAITHSRKVFLGLLEDGSREDPPLHLWIRFQAHRTEGDAVGFYTYGMEQFGLMEIEVESCDWDPLELTDLIYNIANYLIDNGPVINDGDTVGGDENERISVTHAASLHDPDTKVYRVRIGDA
jgi:hypothetical protein